VKPGSQVQAVDAGRALEEPGGQASHAAEPGVGLNLPGPQSSHGAPSAVCLPAAQDSHVAPDRPGSHTQSVEALLPAGALELALQGRHADLSAAEKELGGQSVHLSVDALTLDKYFPAAQSVHARGPLRVLYLLETQPTHTAPTSDQPALHMQWLGSSLCPEECESARHGTHSDLSMDAKEPAGHSLHAYTDALGVSELFPASQVTHACGPGCNLYFPAAQPTHNGCEPDQPA